MVGFIFGLVTSFVFSLRQYSRLVIVGRTHSQFRSTLAYMLFVGRMRIVHAFRLWRLIRLKFKSIWLPCVFFSRLFIFVRYSAAVRSKWLFRLFARQRLGRRKSSTVLHNKALAPDRLQFSRVPALRKLASVSSLPAAGELVVLSRASASYRCSRHFLFCRCGFRRVSARHFAVGFWLVPSLALFLHARSAVSRLQVCLSSCSFITFVVFLLSKGLLVAVVQVACGGSTLHRSVACLSLRLYCWMRQYSVAVFCGCAVFALRPMYCSGRNVTINTRQNKALHPTAYSSVRCALYASGGG